MITARERRIKMGRLTSLVCLLAGIFFTLATDASPVPLIDPKSIKGDIAPHVAGGVCDKLFQVCTKGCSFLPKGKEECMNVCVKAYDACKNHGPPDDLNL